MHSHLTPPDEKIGRHDVELGSSSITKVLKEHCVTLSVPVPVTAFEEGYAALYTLLDNPDFFDAVECGGLTDDQLRLRIALFHQAARLLPLTPMEFLRWAESIDNGQYTQWFIGNRITAEDGYAALEEMSEDDLEALTDHLIACRRERESKRAA